MRVVVNARFLTQPLTGVQRFAIEISKALSYKYKHHFHFVSPKTIIQKGIIDNEVLEMFGTTNGHFWEQVELVRYLMKYPKEQRPILLNLGSTAPVFYNKKITTLHDLAYISNPDWFTKKFTTWYKFIIPKILKSSVHVLTVSEFSRLQISKHYKIPQGNITVIYNALARSFVDQELCDKETVITNPYILSFLSPSPRKNIKNIIAAFRKVRKRKPALELVLVGDYSAPSFPEGDVRKLIKDDETIVMTGVINDNTLKKYYQNAACFVYPSLYEGFGIPPLEAASVNCPSVVSNNSALPEIYRDTVKYCNPNDAENIANAILEIIENKSLRLDLVEKGKANLKRFNWEKSADKIFKLIKSIDG